MSASSALQLLSAHIRFKEAMYFSSSDAWMKQETHRYDEMRFTLGLHIILYLFSLPSPSTLADCLALSRNYKV